MAFRGEALLPAAEGGEPYSLPLRRDPNAFSDPIEHEKTVVKFLQSHEEDLAKCLPAGSMIECLLARKIITQNERDDLAKRRDYHQVKDEDLAEAMIALVLSNTKTAEQRINFLRVIEETRASGISKTILKGIWALLQLQSMGGDEHDGRNTFYYSQTDNREADLHQQNSPSESEVEDTAFDYVEPGGKKCSQSVTLALKSNFLTPNLYNYTRSSSLSESFQEVQNDT